MMQKRVRLNGSGSRRGNGRNAADIDSFAQRITAAWQQAVASILETGRLLIQAKDELRHGEFGKMIESKLPFGSRTAQRLMCIASSRVLSNATYLSHLPPSWSTLYLLTQMPEEELERLLADGTITCETQSKDVEEIFRRIAEQGVYKWEDLGKSFDTIIRFMKRWPNPEDIVRHVSELLEGDDFPRLLPWIECLLAACQHEFAKSEAEWQARHAARDAEDAHEAE
jgi:hypothetical protein